MTARCLTMLGFAFLGMTCGLTPVDAGILPHRTIDDCAVHADRIVEGTVFDGRVTVTAVHAGKVEVGDELLVDRLAELPDVAYDESRINVNPAPEGRSVEEAGALLFLVAGDGDAFEPCGLGSGVRWIFGRSVYAYLQTINPGPYELLPDRDTPTLDELHRALAEGLAQRATFRDAVVDPDRRRGAQALAPFLRPGTPHHAFRRALTALESMGPDGARPMIEALERGGHSRRDRAILFMALGRHGDTGSTPFLMATIDRARALAETPGEVGRDALEDWRYALQASAAIADPRAASAFRDAAIWAVEARDADVLAVAVYGLQTTPDPDHVPAFRQLLDAFREIDGGFGTRAGHRILMLLPSYDAEAVVPLLDAALDHPDERHRRLAREGLAALEPAAGS